MADANLVEKLAVAKTAHDIYGILDGSTAIELAMDAIEYILSGEWKNNLEKACILEFCCRHGGVNMTNVRRFSPIWSQRTNRCSTCRCPGHDKNHCNSKFKALASKWGLN